MSTEMNEHELLRRLKALPREMAPEHDVWPSVMSRISAGDRQESTQSSTRRWRSLAMAAGILVAFATGLLLGPKWLASPAGNMDDIQLARNDAALSPYPPELSAALAASEMEYQAAFREFMSVSNSNNNLMPMTVEKLMISWNEMKQSETGLTNALLENPDNPFLNTRMMELRARQLQFLQQVAALDHNSRRISI